MSKLDKELHKFPDVDKLEDGTYIIKRGAFEKKGVELEKGNYYVIGVSSTNVAKDMIENTRVNWNSGQYLKSSFLKCEVVSLQGNMVRIHACGFDPVNNNDLEDVYFNFWVHKSTIYIVSKVEV